jgi:hypothetical protein
LWALLLGGRMPANGNTETGGENGHKNCAEYSRNSDRASGSEDCETGTFD